MKFPEDRAPIAHPSIEDRLHDEFFDVQFGLEQDLENSPLRAATLDPDEQVLFACLCLTLGEDASEMSPRKLDAGLRAVEFAKRATQRITGRPELPYLYQAQPDAESITKELEVHDLAISLREQADEFEDTHRDTTELIARFNVDIDASGEYTGFAVAVAQLSFAAIEQQALIDSEQALINSARASIDEELAALFGTE